jgi:hypothetical protein
MKMSPTPDPLFISDPSKYIVQYSYSTGASGVWVSIHSVTKSASSWDLMAFRGAYVMPSPLSSTPTW